MRSKQLMIALTRYEAKQTLDLLRSTGRATGTITGFNSKGEPVI